MATRIYIAIAETSKTSNVVADDVGYTYTQTFASLALAFADATHGFKDITILGSDEEYFYDVFDSYTEANSSAVDTSNFTVNVDNQVVVRAAPNLEHKGIVGAGVEITWNQNYTTKYTVYPYITFKDLGFVAGGTNSVGIAIWGGTVVRCMNKSSGTGNSAAAFRLISPSSKLISSFAYDSGSDGIVLADYADDLAVYNCVALGCAGVGIRDLMNYGSGSRYIKNNAAFNNGTDMSKVAAPNGSGILNDSNNATGDATALGANSLTNRIVSNEINNPTVFNAHLVAGNSLETAGIDLVLAGELVADEFRDIDGQPFTGFPIGLDQTGAFTVPTKITAYDAESLEIIQGVSVYVFADTGGGLPIGTAVTDGVTDVSGEINTTPEFSGVQPVVIQGRKGSVSPFYQEAKSKGVLTGAGLIGTIYMITDEA